MESLSSSHCGTMTSLCRGTMMSSPGGARSLAAATAAASLRAAPLSGPWVASGTGMKRLPSQEGIPFKASAFLQEKGLSSRAGSGGARTGWWVGETESAKGAVNVSARRIGRGSVNVSERGSVRVSAASESGETTSGSTVQEDKPVGNAEEAVNTGLDLFKKGKVREALRLFDLALQLNPTKEEAQAALYNKACCHAYREEGQPALLALKEALAKYDLRFSVILSDPDLAPFRALPEFRELQEEARRGGVEVGSTFRRDLKLISETRAPFRGVRKFIYIAFIAAAGISTFFTVPRVIIALQGAEGAPDLLTTVGNLAINLGGGALFVWLFRLDQQKEEEQIVRISRDETLSRLPVRVQSGRIVELVQLRDSSRPVIVAGRKESVAKSMKQAEGYRKQLVERGVVVIPLVLGDDWKAEAEAAAAKRKGFGGQAKGARAPPANAAAETLDEFEARAREAAAKRVSEVERRFKAEPASTGEWLQWIREQQDAEGVKSGDDVYILLRLDGRVRKSGKGLPDWAEIVTETPVLDSLLSKLER